MLFDRAIKNLLYSLLYFFSKQDSQITAFIVDLFRFASKTFRNYYFLPMAWLDQAEANNKYLLRRGGVGNSYPPHCINGRPLIKEVHFSDINCHIFRNSRISVTSSSVILNDKNVFIERVAGLDQTKFNYASGHIRSHGISSAIVQLGDTEYIEKGLFLGGNGSSNYYHWLVEILPKLQFLPFLPDRLAQYPLLVNEDIQKIPTLKEAMNLLVSDCEIIYLDKYKSYHVGKLVYIDSPSNLPFNLRDKEIYDSSYSLISRDSINYIRNTTFKELHIVEQLPPDHSKRIFLCRRNIRRNYNQNEVFDLLEVLGFEEVYMEDLNIEDQVRLMQQSEWIVGPTGAAWTNLIFCLKGAKCLCWMAEEYAEFSAYSTIARIIGADLRYIYYKAGVTSTSDLYRKEYSIDVDLIKAGLYKLGIEEGLL